MPPPPRSVLPYLTPQGSPCSWAGFKNVLFHYILFTEIFSLLGGYWILANSHLHLMKCHCQIKNLAKDVSYLTPAVVQAGHNKMNVNFKWISKKLNIVTVVLLVVWVHCKIHVAIECSWKIMKLQTHRLDLCIYAQNGQNMLLRITCTFSFFHYRLRQAIQGKKVKVSNVPFIYLLSLLPV